MRTHLKEATQQPPEEVWDEIRSRMNANGSVKKTPRRPRRGLWVSVAVAATAVTAAAIILLSAGDKTPLQPVAQPVAEEIVALPAYEEQQAVQQDNPSLPEVAVKRQQRAVAVKAAKDEKTEEYDFSEVDVQIAEAVESDSPAEVYQPMHHQQQKTSPAVSDTAKADKPKANQMDKEKKQQPAKEEIPEFSIPNILTPNGDGFNDCWLIPDLAKYGRASVQIFTAQRKRVYASDDYRGDFCGEGLPSGNYFYVLTIRKYNYVRRGVLVIQR